MGLLIHVAACCDCAQINDSPDAMRFAQEHMTKTGHKVWLKLEYLIKPEMKKNGRPSNSKAS